MLWTFIASCAISAISGYSDLPESPAQDTIWLDQQKRQVAGRNGAVAFRVTEHFPDSTKRIWEYSVDGRLKMQSDGFRKEGRDMSYYVSYDSLGSKVEEGMYHGTTREGLWRFYSNGRLLTEEEYLNRKANGIYRRYDPGSGLLLVEGSQRNGEQSGAWRQYYPGTRLFYREGIFKYGLRDGIFRTYHFNGRLKRLENYDWGTVTSGRCFDSVGNEVAYSPFIIQPEYPDNLDSLLDQEVYDRGTRNKGLRSAYTSFHFVITANGAVNDLQFYNVGSVNEGYIRRFVARMKRWKPMLLDGKAFPCRAECTLSVWDEGARISVVFLPR